MSSQKTMMLYIEHSRVAVWLLLFSCLGCCFAPESCRAAEVTLQSLANTNEGHQDRPSDTKVDFDPITRELLYGDIEKAIEMRSEHLEQIIAQQGADSPLAALERCGVDEWRQVAQLDTELRGTYTEAIRIAYLGSVALNENRRNASRQQLTRALELLEIVGEPSSYSNASVRSALALVEMRLDNVHKAVEYLEVSVSVKKELLGEKQPAYLHALIELAVANVRCKDFEAAEAYLDEVIHQAREQNARHTIWYANALQVLSYVRLDQGRPLEAQALCLHSRGIAIEAGVVYPRFEAQIAKALGYSLIALGNFNEAEKTLQPALGYFEQGFAQSVEVSTEVFESYSSVLRKLGRDAEAEQVDARLVELIRAKPENQ